MLHAVNLTGSRSFIPLFTGSLLMYDFRTRALLGICATEIHVCGGLEAAQIVRSLSESCGDDFTLIQYERLSSLQ